HRDEALRAGEDDLERVARPGPSRLDVRDASPEIHDEGAVVDDRKRRPELVEGLETGLEGSEDGFEARSDEAARLGRSRHAPRRRPKAGLASFGTAATPFSTSTGCPRRRDLSERSSRPATKSRKTPNSLRRTLSGRLAAMIVPAVTPITEPQPIVSAGR